jgi:hypothetical protein
MAAEAIAFAIGALIFLTVIGLGLTTLLLPGDGFEVLLAPAAGLAVLALGFEWLTFLAPPYVAALVVFVVFGALSAVVAWRRRKKLGAQWPDLLGAGAVILVFFTALIQVVLQRGYFTLGGFPSDNVFIYVQAAQYLLDHAMPLAHHVPSLANPGSVYLANIGPAFPNSVGPIDAAASVLSGWPNYAVFDLINGLALAITVGPVWFFVRSGLGASWWTASAAGALLASSQLLYWVMGNGFQQESMALPIFIAGLAATGFAIRAGNARAGALAGVLAASLLGLYLPVAVLLAVCAVGCAVVRLIVNRKAGWAGLLRPAAGAVGAGVVAGLAAFYVLLFQGGLSIWVEVARIRVPAGGISRFPLPPYLLGTLPFAHVWELLPQPYGTLERLAFPLLVLASVLLVILLVLGFGRAAIQGHAPEAAILGAGGLFAAYEAVVAHYPYGFVKSIGYMAPLTSVFVAFGAIGLETLARPSWRRMARIGGLIALGLVLVASSIASRDMVRLWVEDPGSPTFPPAYIALSGMASDVPAGAHVLIDDPTTDYAELIKIAAVAYFLPDRSVRVFAGDKSAAKFADQSIRPQPCAFDYVISPAAPPEGGFSLAGSDAAVGLNVYRRLGAACAA